MWTASVVRDRHDGTFECVALDFRPLLCTMQYSQDANRSSAFAIDGDVGRAGNHQFPRADHTAVVTHRRESAQHFHCVLNTLIDPRGSLRIVPLDVVEDARAIGVCRSGPGELQPSTLPAFFSAASRRMAKCASTSSCASGVRLSSSASCTRARNQASCSFASVPRMNGRTPSFAVRVSRIRTASETVRPILESTEMAFFFTSESTRVCTSALAAIYAIVMQVHDIRGVYSSCSRSFASPAKSSSVVVSPLISRAPPAPAAGGA